MGALDLGYVHAGAAMLRAPCIVPAAVLREVARDAPGCATPGSEAACLILYEIDYNTHAVAIDLQPDDVLDRAAIDQWCHCGRPLPDIIDMRMSEQRSLAEGG